MRLRRCLDVLAYHAVRPLRLVTRLAVREDTRRQLARLAWAGQGLAVNGPLTLGAPEATFLDDGVCINPDFTTLGGGELFVGERIISEWTPG